MTKFLAVCSSGLGSSFILQMNIEKALREIGATDITVDHEDLGSVTAASADTVFVGRDIAEAAEGLGDVVVLNNIIDQNEILKKVKEAVNRHR